MRSWPGVRYMQYHVSKVYFYKYLKTFFFCVMCKMHIILRMVTSMVSFIVCKISGRCNIYMMIIRWRPNLTWHKSSTCFWRIVILVLVVFYRHKLSIPFSLSKATQKAFFEAEVTNPKPVVNKDKGGESSVPGPTTPRPRRKRDINLSLLPFLL